MNMSGFQDKVCVITGAASGIGRALTLELAEAGAVLALSDVNEEGLSETAQLAGLEGSNRVLIDRLDVADAAQIAAYPAKVAAALGGADYLFNVAGLTRVGSFMNTPLDSMEKVMDVNFWGVVRMSKAFIDQLIERKGTLVNISSVFGLIGYPGQTHYCASKFAVRGFTETLAHEFDGTDIGICSVHPGGVATNIARNATVDKMPDTGKSREEMDAEFDELAITTPQKAAQIIMKGALKRKRRIIIGADAKVASFIQRLFPVQYMKILNKYTGDRAALGKQ